jgi:hypothetical protein
LPGKAERRNRTPVGAQVAQKKGKEMKYCKRPGCGHEEGDHLTTAGAERGRCSLTVPEGNHMVACSCHEFMAEEGQPKSERPKLKSVPPSQPEPMSAVALDLLQQGLAQRGEVKDFEVVHGQKVEPVAVPMRGVELDLKITLAGKVRTLTELAATANVLVRETGCDDLADAAAILANKLIDARAIIGSLRGQRLGDDRALIEARAEIRELARENADLARQLAAEREGLATTGAGRGVRPVLVELQFNIAAESADPETLASKLRAVCEAAAKVGGV